MALASQSPRSTRQFQPSQRFGMQFLVLGVAAVASLGAGWWLMRADAGSTDIASAAPSSLATSVPAGSSLDHASHVAMRTPEALDAASNESSRADAGSALDQVVADAGRDAAIARNEVALHGDTAPAIAQTEPAAPTVPTATPPASTPNATPSAPAETTEQTPKKSNGIVQGERAASAPTANAGSPGGNLAQGLSLAASEPVKARALLSSAILSGELSPLDAKRCSDALVEIGRVLAFTPVYNANDPMFFQYTVQSGDSLEKIVRRHKIGCDWRLVQRINNVKKPEAIRVGQRLKLPKGPFSAVVSKRDYRVDLCVGAGAERVVLTSLPCGLGSANGTPTGNFKVRVGSKLLNPEWTHPVTGEHFAGDDPKNPIGEHWLGLEGTDATNAQLAGYGIHGTIDVDSIGQDRSLGCVRLLSDDVALVWECLGDGAVVEIRP